ncbi:MAG: CoA transferase [Dehalococcoidia bacterium]|nr:CoA transferase [Dehalococcoidia bacterium]
MVEPQRQPTIAHLYKAFGQSRQERRRTMTTTAPRPRTDLPLEGVRILDLTVVWAGPYGAMQLADWGAEVIRIESINHFANNTRGQMARPPKAMMALRAGGMGYLHNDPGERPWNRYSTFNASSRNKLSMTVDMTRPEGQEIFNRLVRVSDGLVENNVPVSMDRLGITWERLSALNPRFVMVRQPAFGLDGPYQEYRTWGNHMEAIAGHPLLRGYPGQDVSQSPSGVPSDAAGGVGGAMAFLMGLRYRKRTGQGVMIEVATAENFVPFLGDYIMDYTMNDRVSIQQGNQHFAWAPHQAYPCQGDDKWVAIVCRDDAEWQQLCTVMAVPDLAQDTRFRDSLSRWNNRDALDQIIAQWTRPQGASDVMHRLQAAGVPAGAVMNEADALADPQLRARGLFQTVTHPEAETQEQVGPLFRMGKTTNPIWRHAPRLGEDNEYIYKKVLGYSDAEYHRLEGEGHIGMDYDPSVP